MATHSILRLVHQTLMKPTIEPTGWLMYHAFCYERARQIGLVRPQCCLNDGQLNEITLGEAATASICNMTHPSQPLHAADVVALSEDEQCLAEPHHELIFQR
jgi:hypothetical protein